MGISTDSVAESYRKLIEIRGAISSIVLGQDELISGLLIAAMTNNHALIEGLPGLAKSLAVSTFADTIESSFTRIQFTPDLLPADLTGTQIFDPRDTQFHTRKGPIFSNVILADEINRAPAKVHSALLEAMEEGSVTIGGNTLELPAPFLVLATQNPIEHEATYRLPEAQLDRFMLKIVVKYPEMEDERSMLDQRLSRSQVLSKAVISAGELQAIQDVTSQVDIDPKIRDYILRLVRASRIMDKEEQVNMSRWIEYGASPRASIFFVEGTQALALLNSREYVLPEDVKQIAKPILRHRLVLTYQAEAEGITTDDVIDQLLENVPIS
ncbi:MAG: MoxR family ATPase [Dehalococcoidia bacterium]|nr:MoxR family ATPase [Dehalococcoidia bacterium]